MIYNTFILIIVKNNNIYIFYIYTYFLRTLEIWKYQYYYIVKTNIIDTIYLQSYYKNKT